MFQLDSKLEEDTIILASLPLCEMRLMDDKQYPWIILVPRRANLRELVELNAQDSVQLQIESNAVSWMLLKGFHAEKLNIASLGNVVAQLHVHHIARFVNDCAWPRPVWGVAAAEPYAPEEAEAVVAKIKQNFKLPGSQSLNWQL